MAGTETILLGLRRPSGADLWPGSGTPPNRGAKGPHANAGSQAPLLTTRSDALLKQRISKRRLDPEGYPAIKPPWGRLTSIDLNTGGVVWQQPLGEYKELTARGIPVTGTENGGGPIITAGGLIFIAATKDAKFRAFDLDTGKILWESQLDAAGHATPSTYAVKGKQYVVIAAGGGSMVESPSSAEYVAFALPEKQ